MGTGSSGANRENLTKITSATDSPSCREGEVARGDSRTCARRSLGGRCIGMSVISTDFWGGPTGIGMESRTSLIGLRGVIRTGCETLIEH